MREFQNAYPNDCYIEFDRQLACWAHNHNGWRKAKKRWRKIGKKRIRRQVNKSIDEELLEMEGIISDIEKCMGCKFWLYYENEKRERCSIKGCWDNCKYVPYTVEGKK